MDAFKYEEWIIASIVLLCYLSSTNLPTFISFYIIALSSIVVLFYYIITCEIGLDLLYGDLEIVYIRQSFFISFVTAFYGILILVVLFDWKFSWRFFSFHNHLLYE